MRYYVVCTTPRSGSNFLCRELTRRGVFGDPSEFFNFHRPMFGYIRELAAESLDDYIEKLLAQKTSPQGVFGWKAFWFDFIFLRDLAERLNRFQPLTYIYLERKDELAQAVSFAYAQSDGAWTSEHAATAVTAYDRAHIDRALDAVRWNKRGWSEYFSDSSIEPLRLDYDEVTADPEPALRQISLRLDLPAELPPVRDDVEPLRAQHEAVKDEWLQRYRRETGLS